SPMNLETELPEHLQDSGDDVPQRSPQVLRDSLIPEFSRTNDDVVGDNFLHDPSDDESDLENLHPRWGGMTPFLQERPPSDRLYGIDPDQHNQNRGAFSRPWLPFDHQSSHFINSDDSDIWSLGRDEEVHRPVLATGLYPPYSSEIRTRSPMNLETELPEHLQDSGDDVPQRSPQVLRDSLIPEFSRTNDEAGNSVRRPVETEPAHEDVVSLTRTTESGLYRASGIGSFVNDRQYSSGFAHRMTVPSHLNKNGTPFEGLKRTVYTPSEPKIEMDRKPVGLRNTVLSEPRQERRMGMYNGVLLRVDDV
ncbi:hypothetical protein, partial [Enterobacter mori]|uniref:hypothetical protein n=1 Tax=Enterobacter mori TaxID=539813 RepID=UPI001B8AA198